MAIKKQPEQYGNSSISMLKGEERVRLKDIFGYVCTFEGRKPIFHKL